MLKLDYLGLKAILVPEGSIHSTCVKTRLFRVESYIPPIPLHQPPIHVKTRLFRVER